MAQQSCFVRLVRPAAMLILLLTQAGMGAVAFAASSPRPNVALIIVDTLRADKLGCYGFLEDISPELDALARKGVQFVRTVSQCSWTRPSIASMLTSRYPRSLGLYKEENQALDDRFTTLAEILRHHGYRTVGVTANPNINSLFNMQQGFDVYVDCNVVFDAMASTLPSTEGVELLRSGRFPAAVSLFDRLIEEVQKGEAGPYYLQATIMEIHEAGRAVKNLTRPEFRDLYDKLPSRGYLRAVRQVSVDIGAFVKKLSALPGWRNTLFVITSDHGEGLWDHPHVLQSSSHGPMLYESQIMVPLLLYHAGGALPSRKVERPIRLLDLMPTLLEYLELPIPTDADGQSVLPLIVREGSSVSLPEGFVVETRFRSFNKTAVFSDAWKYFENRDSHNGLNPRELQRVGIKENGKRTDEIDQRPEVAEKWRSFLESWEEEHPEVPPTPCRREASQDEIDQFKAIGYLN